MQPFLEKMGEPIELNKYEDEVLSFVTKELLNGKRAHELVLLKMLLKQNFVKQEDYLAKLQHKKIYVNDEVLSSVDDILDIYRFFDVKQAKILPKKLNMVIGH